MKVEVLSREIIRPFTSTPSSLREHSLSLIDELSPGMYVPIILYYAADPHTSTSRCEHLKLSLSKVLTRFYPFAGRYMKDSVIVDCSDQGAEFVEAVVDVRLDDLVGQGKHLKTEMLNHLMPCAIGASGEVSDPLLAVQVSCFACGGWAIGVMSSHKIADMSTTCTFINEWAIAAKRLSEGLDENQLPIVSPIWDSASLFPGKKLPGITFQMSREKQDVNDHKIATKVFSFNSSAISKICERARVNNSSASLPSRLQSVCGMIGKSMIDINADACTKEFIAIQPLNMRQRTVPPISKNQCGNLYLLTSTQIMAGEAGVELHSIADLFTRTVKRGLEKCKAILSPEGPVMISDGVHEVTRTLARPNISALSFSDWSKFPFYEADFGSGKPVWVSIANLPGPNCVFLLSDKSGEGIEAWVNLNLDEMLKFEQDPSIMEYST